MELQILGNLIQKCFQDDAALAAAVESLDTAQTFLNALSPQAVRSYCMSLPVPKGSSKSSKISTAFRPTAG